MIDLSLSITLSDLEMRNGKILFDVPVGTKSG